jgi:peptidoglycan/LPS O-acetylase OafA/YrhL
VYFGSDTRAFELLAGVLLAIVIRFEVPGRVVRWSGRHVVVGAAAVGPALRSQNRLAEYGLPPSAGRTRATIR